MSVRRTNSQKQILSLLKQLQGEINAQDLYVKLRERGETLGLATVYRGLKALKLEGTIQERVSPTGESFYSLISKDHQHHLNCVGCGRSLSLDICPIEQQLIELCQAKNFQIFYHTLEFFGLCHACQNQQPN
ncbi:MAG: Fur family transcriptional regulator [Prochloraceae cyanobacterium]|nr:Fur family transcriptional regulator [Prochloraceae cyanobacterium]